MSTWQKWINWIARRLGAFGTLDSEKVIRRKNAEILLLRKEVERLRGFAVVYIDPAMRQRGYEQSAWAESPERNTGPVPSPQITRKLDMEEDMKSLLEVNTSELRAIRSKAGQMGVTYHQKFPTGKLNQPPKKTG